jgi:hypothetical protein
MYTMNNVQSDQTCVVYAGKYVANYDQVLTDDIE